LAQVKTNQKQLLTTLEQICKYNQPVEIDITKDNKPIRNRLETRTLSTFVPNIPYCHLGYIYDSDWRKQIKVVIKLDKITQHFKKDESANNNTDKSSTTNSKIKATNSKATKLIKTTKETSYFISTTASLTATQYNQTIRNYWGIEIKNHYVRDEVLQEDRSQIRVNSKVFVRLRSFVLNILRAKNTKNITRQIHENTLNMEEMLRFLFRVE